MGYISNMTEEDGLDDLETDEGQRTEDFRRRLDFRNSVQDEYMESETSEVYLLNNNNFYFF